VAELYEQQFLLPRRRAVADLLRHHMKTGELRADPDSDTAVDILVGSMLGVLLAPGRPGPVPTPQAIVDLLTDGMTRGAQQS
jgi:Tetracyclin repressor-like, C-terminal domain